MSVAHNIQESKIPNNADRRYLPRWEVRNKILFKKAEEETAAHQANSIDITSAGMCLDTSEPVTPNGRLNLMIYLADDIEPIDALGRVVWQKPKSSEGSENIVGIYFERISKQAQDLIFNYAFEYKHAEMVQRWFKGC